MIKDFKLIKGQEAAKRAIEIAVLGGHSMLVCGRSGRPPDRLSTPSSGPLLGPVVNLLRSSPN
jgi:hypothetical protein